MATWYLNGQFVPDSHAVLPVTDLGLLRAFGIFDFFKALDGQPIFLDDHLDRFERSARLMGLPMPAPREELRGLIHELIRLNPYPLLGLKLVLTGGLSPDGYTPAEVPNFFVIAKPFGFLDAPNGLTFMTVPHQRQLSEVKSLDYLLPVYLLRRQREVGADDVLYHHEGLITESSRSNVFLVKNNVLITPARGMLRGVTRKHILNFAAEHFEIEERDVTLAETFGADEVFTTGSSKRLVAVTRIDDKVFGSGRPGPVTEQLAAQFLEYERATV